MIAFPIKIFIQDEMKKIYHHTNIMMLRFSLYCIFCYLTLNVLCINNAYKTINSLCLNSIRIASARTVCWVFSAHIEHWPIKQQWYSEIYSVLQGLATVTATEFYNHMHRVRALRHLLQWAIGWSVLSRRIWAEQCLYWTLWSICSR